MRSMSSGVSPCWAFSSPTSLRSGGPAAAMTDPAIMDATLGENRWNTIGHDLTSIFTLGKMMALFSMLFGVGVIVYARKFDEANASERLGPDAIDRAHRELGENITYTCKDCGYDLAALLPEGTIARDLPRVRRRAAHAPPPQALHRRGVVVPPHAVAPRDRGVPCAVHLVRRHPRLVRRGRARRRLVGPQAGTPNSRSPSACSGTLQHDPDGRLRSSASGPIEHGKIPEGRSWATPPSSRPTPGAIWTPSAARLVSALSFWFMFLPLFLPGITGLMMIGMGLTRLGILTGERPTRLYAGSPARHSSAGSLSPQACSTGSRAVSPTHGRFLWQSMSQFVGIPISLGYMGCSSGSSGSVSSARSPAPSPTSGAWRSPTTSSRPSSARPSSTGTASATSAEIDYPGLFAVIAAVWIINLVFSAVWLRFFRFGPAEWAWRSLTYWEIQPMRR
jgi:hypothetical protein